MFEIPCGRCGASLSPCLGGISILVMGDEYIYSYFFCERCDEYTAESYRDRFMGGSYIGHVPYISKEEGERILKAIKACPKPSDKHCRCPSHEALYTGRINESE